MRGGSRTARQRSRPAATPGNGAARLTKAGRREQARLERDRQLDVGLRRQKLRRSIGPAALVVVVAMVAAAAVSRSGRTNGPVREAQGIPGVLMTEAPWPANAGDLPARLALLGLPEEGTAMHIHSHLDLYVNGVHESVPANLGIGTSGAAPIHTHDASGIIHLESAELRTFTLAELFDVWGVRMTSGCIGGYCENRASKLWVFVDGKTYSDLPGSVPLRSHSEIVLAYGPRDTLPDPMPAGFDFGAL